MCRAPLKDKPSRAADRAVLDRRPHRRPKLYQQDQAPIQSLNPIDAGRRLKWTFNGIKNWFSAIQSSLNFQKKVSEQALLTPNQPRTIILEI